MKNQKGFTIVEVVFAIAFLFIVISWIVNVVKLTECDFNAPYKAEVVHAIGVVVPPASLVTAWIDVGN